MHETRGTCILIEQINESQFPEQGNTCAWEQRGTVFQLTVVTNHGYVCFKKLKFWQIGIHWQMLSYRDNEYD